MSGERPRGRRASPRRTTVIAGSAERKFDGADELAVSSGARRVRAVAKASSCTPADVLTARRRDDAKGSNSVHGETPDFPVRFGPAPLPEGERPLRAAPRGAAPVCPPRPASITSSR